MDPGDCIADKVRELGCSDTLIVVTHGHFDHTQGVDCLKQAGAALAAHPMEPRVARESARIARRWGIDATIQESTPDLELSEATQLGLGDHVFNVVYTPGHSPDHIILYTTTWRPMAIVGDLIFKGGVGRVDLPGSSPAEMRASLRKVTGLLSPSTLLLPGHGPETVMGEEIRWNPFLRDPGLI